MAVLELSVLVFSTLTYLVSGACNIPPQTEYFDIQLTRSEVSDTLTEYVCQQYKIPEALLHDDYHAVAFQPLIDNEHVMHHMILFGCEDGAPPSEPHICGTPEDRCRSYITVWTMGLQESICTFKDTGVLFGKSASKVLSLQLHWNNAAKIQNMTDASGMRIYYTQHLRAFNLGNVQFGQNDIEIPPATLDYAQSGNCSSYCTGHLLPRPIYLTRTYIHMHYLGTRGLMQQFRNGKFIRNISEALDYSYNIPPIDEHKTAIEILPGDEVKLTCWFDTDSALRARNHVVYWGEGSEAEMCYAFVSYYPKVTGFDQCVQFAHYDQCDNYNSGDLVMGKCEYSEFWRDANSIIGLARQQCNEQEARNCSSACTRALQRIYSHDCMQGRLLVFVKTQFMKTTNWKQLDEWYDISRTNCN